MVYSGIMEIVNILCPNGIKSFYIYDGYVYSKNKNGITNVNLKCSIRSCYGKCVATPSNKGVKFQHITVDHNHEKSFDIIDTIKFKRATYARAEVEDVPFRVIFDEELLRYPLATVTFASIRKCLERSRKASQSPLSLSLHELAAASVSCQLKELSPPKISQEASSPRKSKRLQQPPPSRKNIEMSPPKREIRKAICTDKSPVPIGPFSQGIQCGNLVFVSGHVGMNPKTMELVEGGVVPETEQALKCIGAVLEAAGLSFRNVVKTTVLLADMNDFAAVNQVYSKFFSEPYPARAAYQVVALPKQGARVEIEAVAVTRE